MVRYAIGMGMLMLGAVACSGPEQVTRDKAAPVATGPAATCAGHDTTDAPPLPYIAVERVGPFVDVDAACAHIVATSDEPTDAAVESSCMMKVPDTDTAGQSVPMLISASASTTAVWTLGLRSEAGIHLYEELALVYNPGAFGIFEDLEVARFEQQGDRVLIELAHNRSDSDLGANEITLINERVLKICRVGDDSLRCLPTYTQAYRVERSLLSDDPEIEPPDADHSDLGTSSLTYNLTLCDGGFLASEAIQSDDASLTPAIGVVLDPGVYSITP